MSACSSRRSLLATLGAALALTLLAGCGGPRQTDATTVDALALDRGPVVGAQERGRSGGVRALNAPQPKAISALRSDMRSSLFREREDEGATFAPYLNGLLPTAGEAELAYPGDRVGWVRRDASDPSQPVTAVVGLFPAPFTTRFTVKRRYYPVRIQCATVGSRGCDGTEAALIAEDVRVTTSNLTDQASRNVVRLIVGPWNEIRDVFTRGRLGAGLVIEEPADRNGYRARIDADGKVIEAGAAFGEASATPPMGAGTGLIFALRDSLGLPVWVITGTDSAGVERAAGALTQDALAGRISAIVPAR